MSKKTDEAIAKITAEALKINNSFSIFIEEHLTKICTNDIIATRLLEGESLEAFCRECEQEARKRAQKQGGGFQVNGLPDAEYQKMAEEYYGITEADKSGASRTAGNIIDITELL